MHLHIPLIDPMDADDEVIWTGDGLPISRIKFVTSIAANVSLRWLVVQKETSTTILCPEYHKIQVAENKSYVRLQQSLSRVQPNPLITIGHQETGGNAHSDVAFNPGHGDHPPQLCIMDECGYWTLWNVANFTRTDKKRLRLSLFRCGHIWEGSLNSIPSTPGYPAENHGVIFGGAGRDRIVRSWDVERNNFEAMRTRSNYILQWNSERIEISDTVSSSVLPKIPDFSTTRFTFGRIVDVQANPRNQNQIFILTACFVVWVDLSPISEDLGARSAPRILLTTPHEMAGKGTLKMDVTPATHEGSDPLVSVFSSQGSRATILWFWLRSDNGLPQWHSQIITISQNSDDGKSKSDFRELILRPLRLEPPPAGRESLYLKAGVQFFQGMLLCSDLSVEYCMCFSTKQPALGVELPTTRVGWTHMSKEIKWQKKRSQLVHHMEKTVIIPDHMTDEVLMGLSQRLFDADDDDEEYFDEDGGGYNAPKAVVLNLDIFRATLRDHLAKGASQGRKGASVDLLETIQKTLQHGHAVGKLPLTTW